MTSLADLEANFKKHRKAWRADKSDADLKKAFKKAKKAFVAAGGDPTKKSTKKSKKGGKRKLEEATEAPPAKKAKKEETTETETETPDIAALEKAVKVARKKFKKDKTDKAAKKALRLAKKALEDAKASASSEEAEEEEEKPAEEEEKPAEGGDDVLAGLMKKKEPAPAATGGKFEGHGNPPNEKCFVGNLSFNIDDDTVRDFFKDCGTITDIYWLEDKESGRFKGCGFITFDSIDASTKAVAKTGEILMERDIRVDFAKGKSGGGGNKGGSKKGKFVPRELSEKPEGCTTVFAGNLSFDIEDSDMRSFAEDCGEIMKIRWLTDRNTGDFKGCGFVEFYDEASVDKFILKNGEMLKGRNINLDYAKARG